MRSRRNSTRTPISAKFSGSGKLTQAEIDAAKAENDYYRRQLMEKKSLIENLEKKAPKLEEYKRILTFLIQDSQKNGQFIFEDDEKQLENPFETTTDGVALIRKGIDNFIAYHERMVSRFELEFSSTLFPLKQKLEEKRKELQTEEQLLFDTLADVEQKKSMIGIIVNQKSVLKKTILMLRDSLNNRITSDNNQLEMKTQRMNKFQNRLERIQIQVQQEEDIAAEIIKKCQERKEEEVRQTNSHQEILSTVQQLRSEYRSATYAHNLTRSALDRAKEELFRLTREVESYRDNLKTQELLNAEVENRRLRAVINNEKNDFEETLAKHTAKTNELTKIVNDLSNRIERLNLSISSVEQRLQTQMMKIPDFDQLNLILDRSLEQSKRQKEFILKRKNMLDQIRDKNRDIEQQDVEESKLRMSKLKSHMPLRSEQAIMQENNKIPILLEKHRQWQKEMRELLNSPGF